MLKFSIRTNSTPISFKMHSFSLSVDQKYNPESKNAQSGLAVAEAVGGKVDKITGKYQVYVTDSEGNQYSREYSAREAKPYTFPYRGKDGQLLFKTPEDNDDGTYNDNEGVSKKYFHDKLAKIPSPVVDQEYNSESENAQSGIAVAQAVDNSIGDIEAAIDEIIQLQTELIELQAIVSRQRSIIGGID